MISWHEKAITRPVQEFSECSHFCKHIVYEILSCTAQGALQILIQPYSPDLPPSDNSVPNTKKVFFLKSQSTVQLID